MTHFIFFFFAYHLFARPLRESIIIQCLVEPLNLFFPTPIGPFQNYLSRAW